jgi:agmatine deiminase
LPCFHISLPTQKNIPTMPTPFTPDSPAARGYRMPAEWEPHEATWLTWPRRNGISFPDRFDTIPAYWVQMCRLLSEHETVHINTFDSEHEEEIRVCLRDGDLAGRLGKSIQLHRFPAYEPWCRDHGPLFVTRHEEPRLAIVNWGYNAWGDKYPPYDLDNKVPHHVAQWMDVPLFEPDMILEGGSIEVNGRGTLLTTSSCLLHPNRNPTLTRDIIEQKLRDYLGVHQIVWLGEGIQGDDTDGHVDDLSRFTSPDTIVTVVESEPSDPNFAPLLENYEKLLELRSPEGRPFRICTLPMPPPLDWEGQRLPASYANFYIANKLVLVPTFNASTDGDALVTLKELFPERKVVGIDCRDLVWGLGAFHCVTQQQPALRPR